MSTKIYNGFKLNINNDIKSLQDFVLNLRKDIEGLATKQFIGLVASRVARIYNIRNTSLDDEEKELVSKKTGLPLVISINDEVYRWVKKQANSNLRDPLLDLCFELSIFEHKDSIYGMYFCDNREFERYFLSLEEIEDFHYQNQVDKPDDVTETEWNNREDIWDEILPNVSTPAECGISIEIYKPDYNLLMWYLFIDTDEDINKRDKLLRKHIPKHVEYQWTEKIS